MDFYFESAAMILTLITVGKMLEARSKGKTTDALKSLMSLAPRTASVLRDGREVEVPVEGGEYVTAAKIGRAVMDADIFISLAHFKGHEATGFGGAIKNIGMGCGSRAGKMEQHCSGKVSVNPKRCRGCGACARNCAQGAISYGEDRKAVIDEDKCVGCGRCIGHCNFDAIRNNNFNAGELLNRKMAEYTKAVLAGRPGFHINMVIDISPSCDCCPTNDAPILPDIGMFASCLLYTSPSPRDS